MWFLLGGLIALYLVSEMGKRRETVAYSNQMRAIEGGLIAGSSEDQFKKLMTSHNIEPYLHDAPLNYPVSIYNVDHVPKAFIHNEWISMEAVSYQFLIPAKKPDSLWWPGNHRSRTEFVAAFSAGEGKLIGYFFRSYGNR